MILSTSTNLFAFRSDGGRNSLEFCIEQAAKAGYTLLDINFCEAMNPSSRMRGKDWEAFVDELGQLGQRCKVHFTQSHLPYYDIFGNTDPEKAATMEELIRRSIIASGRLGVKWMVTHPGTVYSAGQDMAVSLQKNHDYYSVHLETAVKAGAGIALENDFEYKTKPYQRIFASSMSELCQLADSFGSPMVGVCYDFGHGNLTGGFHRQNLNQIGQRLKAVHVADNKGERDEHLLPFFGSINWAEAMAGLSDIDYPGELTYEVQEFTRYLPNDLKYAGADLSVTVGNYLIALYEQAVEQKRLLTS